MPRPAYEVLRFRLRRASAKLPRLRRATRAGCRYHPLVGLRPQPSGTAPEVIGQPMEILTCFHRQCAGGREKKSAVGEPGGSLAFDFWPNRAEIGVACAGICQKRASRGATEVRAMNAGVFMAPGGSGAVRRAHSGAVKAAVSIFSFRGGMVSPWIRCLPQTGQHSGWRSALSAQASETILD